MVPTKPTQKKRKFQENFPPFGMPCMESNDMQGNLPRETTHPSWDCNSSRLWLTRISSQPARSHRGLDTGGRRLGGLETEIFLWQVDPQRTTVLGGGFEYFLCSPLFGEMIHFDFDEYFSIGLKPPTSCRDFVGLQNTP